MPERVFFSTITALPKKDDLLYQWKHEEIKLIGDFDSQ